MKNGKDRDDLVVGSYFFVFSADGRIALSTFFKKISSCCVAGKYESESEKSPTGLGWRRGCRDGKRRWRGRV